LVVAPLGDVVLGLTICFDLRFAELYRALALRGATMFAVPSAFSAVTGPAHWHVLLRARAIENHAFVVAATQAGTTEEGLATYGHAMIIDPWGVALAESSTDQPEVVFAAIDLDEVTRRRREIDVLALRRPELYREAVGDFDEDQ
jgi:predicted amidohydrolase